MGNESSSAKSKSQRSLSEEPSHSTLAIGDIPSETRRRGRSAAKLARHHASKHGPEVYAQNLTKYLEGKYQKASKGEEGKIISDTDNFFNAFAKVVGSNPGGIDKIVDSSPMPSPSHSRVQSNQSSTPQPAPTSKQLTPQEEKEKRARRREQVLNEIIESETLYSGFLNILVQRYIYPLTSFLSPEQLKNVCSNIQSIAPFHEIIAEELSGPNGRQNVVKTFAKYAEYLNLYLPYVQNYENALETTTQLKKDNKQFLQFLESKMEDPACGGLDFLSYLIMPIQRIPRYRMLLEQLKKYTEPDDPELPDLDKALVKVCHTADKVNQSKKKLDDLAKLIEVQNRISTQFHVIAPGRQLILEGDLVRYKRGFEKTIHVFLFNDLLLWTSTPPQYSFKGVVRLASSDIKPEDVHKKPGLVLSCHGMAKDVYLPFTSVDERQYWLDAILKQIQESKDHREKKRNINRKKLIRKGTGRDMHASMQESLKKTLTGTMKKRMFAMQDEETDGMDYVKSETINPRILAAKAKKEEPAMRTASSNHLATPTK